MNILSCSVRFDGLLGSMIKHLSEKACSFCCLRLLAHTTDHYYRDDHRQKMSRLSDWPRVRCKNVTKHVMVAPTVRVSPLIITVEFAWRWHDFVSVWICHDSVSDILQNWAQQKKSWQSEKSHKSLSQSEFIMTLTVTFCSTAKRIRACSDSDEKPNFCFILFYSFPSHCNRYQLFRESYLNFQHPKLQLKLPNRMVDYSRAGTKLIERRNTRVRNDFVDSKIDRVRSRETVWERERERERERDYKIECERVTKRQKYRIESFGTSSMLAAIFNYALPILPESPTQPPRCDMLRSIKRLIDWKHSIWLSSI